MSKDDRSEQEILLWNEVTRTSAAAWAAQKEVDEAINKRTEVLIKQTEAQYALRNYLIGSRD